MLIYYCYSSSITPLPSLILPMFLVSSHRSIVYSLKFYIKEASLHVQKTWIKHLNFDLKTLPLLSSSLNCSWTATNLVAITVTAVTITITIAAIASRMLLTNPQQDYYSKNLTSMDILGETLNCKAATVNRTSRHSCRLYYTVLSPHQCVWGLS